MADLTNWTKYQKKAKTPKVKCETIKANQRS